MASPSQANEPPDTVPTPSMEQPNPFDGDTVGAQGDSQTDSDSSLSVQEEDVRRPTAQRRSTTNLRVRPKIGPRKASGPIVVDRNSKIEFEDEVYDEGDARAMSPRRNGEELERISKDARRQLEEQAKALQSSLLALVDRVETVKSEHDKLEGENKFLQSYIGELMSTSKITASGSGKGKGSRSK